MKMYGVKQKHVQIENIMINRIRLDYGDHKGFAMLFLIKSGLHFAVRESVEVKIRFVLLNAFKDVLSAFGAVYM